MAMQFGRDNRTGQLGYWDGQKFIPLQTVQDQTKQANIADVARDPTVTGTRFENISPADKNAVKFQMKQGQGAAIPTLSGAPLPNQRSAELEQSAAFASEASKDPQYLSDVDVIKQEGRPELAKFLAANVAPALLSGGGTAIGTAAIKGGGLLSRLGRMALGGAGGYAGEKINQATGLSEGDEGTAALSAGIGALPGFFKPKIKALTSDERKIQRLVGGAEVGAKAGVAGETAEDLYTLARAGTDISTDRLLKPLDDLINSSRVTPNIGGVREGEAFLRKLEALRETLVQRVLQLNTRTTPGKPKPIGGVPANIEAGVPATRPTEVGRVRSNKEVNPALTTPFDWLFNKAKAITGSKTTTSGPQMAPGTPSKTRVTSLKVVEQPKQVSPENLVDDLKQLTNQKGLYREAENLGIPGLTQKLKETYKAMATEVPYLPEADLIYGQKKGLERGAKATRSSGAIGVENLLADPKLSGGLTSAQKVFLSEQAGKSDKIGRITQALIQSPLGRSMLRLGVSEKGILVPTAWNAAMQIGARMAGLGEDRQPISSY